MKPTPSYRTIFLIGGPRHSTRSLAAGAIERLLDSYTTGHDEHGEEYLYCVIGECQDGELLAVEV
jgi:hypothetical protein